MRRQNKKSAEFMVAFIQAKDCVVRAQQVRVLGCKLIDLQLQQWIYSQESKAKGAWKQGEVKGVKSMSYQEQMSQGTNANYRKTVHSH
jgi:hypothetical protein